MSRLLRTELRRLLSVLFDYYLLLAFTSLLVFLLLLCRRGVRIGRRRGGDVQRRFRPVCFDHFHRRTARLPLFGDRRNAAVVVHARQYGRRSAFDTRRPPSPDAPQTITPQRRFSVVHRCLCSVYRCPSYAIVYCLSYYCTVAVLSYLVAVAVVVAQLNATAVAL